MKLCALSQFGSLLVVTSPLHAVTLVSDNFTNSTGSGATSINNTEALGVGSYNRIYTGTSSTYTIQPVTNFGDGNAMTLGDGDSTHARSFNDGASFSLSSLNSGDVLSLGFDIRFSGTFNTGEGSRQFSFGFINRTAATQSSIAYAIVGTETGQFRRRTESFNMSTTSNNGGVQIGDNFDTGLTTDISYNFQLSITKTSDTNYLLQYFLDGDEIASANSNLAATAEIDINAIGFRWSTPPGVDTHIDNVLVTLVPEPSSLILAGTGLLSAAFLRRRPTR